MGAPATAAGRFRETAAVKPWRREVTETVQHRLTIVLTIAHALGAIDVFLLLFFVLPLPEHPESSAHLLTNLVAGAVYLPLATAAGIFLGRRASPANAAWVREDRAPNPQERDQILGLPLRCLPVDGGLWLGAAILFGALNIGFSGDLAGHIACTILLGGLTVCAVSYLLVERIMRPVTEIALAAGPPDKPAWPGVEGRMMIAWLSATGVPLLGIGMVAVHSLTEGGDPDVIARSVLVLVGVAFMIGLGVTYVATRTVSAPLTAVRRALARVEAGDLTTGVRVNDASEVGMLQTGFNRMVDGLRERERMEDLYSRQVGADVVREALDAEPRLGGQVRDVAVLFVDLVGSTTYAMEAPPEVVVARLNRFFAIIVDVVAAHGGWVNKFQGDAALCVFGAPAPTEDAAACALAAGRELQQRLRRELPGAEAGIGISAGPAVAGWVGAEKRFEYSVIGDPVNEAARLCELAKRHEGKLLASGDIVRRANRDESGRWRLGDETLLRGRTTPTRVAVPVTA